MKLILIVFICLINYTFYHQTNTTNDDGIDLPKGFPKPIVPEHNEITPERVALGKRLFFDNVMSRKKNLSCSSCHKPELAFTDGQVRSIGNGGDTLLRNSPSLVNIAYHQKGLMLDGGVASLEQQILVPIQEHSEFDFNLLLIAERLKQDSLYIKQSKSAYGRIPDPYVITRAIACYERTLIFGDSKYDRYLNGDSSAMNQSELRGMALFFDELDCHGCHSGFNFTNYEILNNGLFMDSYPLDSGRMRITLKETDRDKFKVPSLRNVEITAPYMHNGMFTTLDQVIDHYASGGKSHKNKDHRIQPFIISYDDKKDLIAFLKSLTAKRFSAEF
ncbi:MAG: cytochrome c peroxidase [Crocinitomicaceae bacterium]